MNFYSLIVFFLVNLNRVHSTGFLAFSGIYVLHIWHTCVCINDDLLIQNWNFETKRQATFASYARRHRLVFEFQSFFKDTSRMLAC